MHALYGHALLIFVGKTFLTTTNNGERTGGGVMAGKGMQIRAGNRGGWDQFDWEDVKVDKHRENYLGK